MWQQWKKIEKLPPGKGLIIEGEGGVWVRFIPFLWKLCNPWVYLKVDGPLPYRLYRADGNKCLEYTSVLYTHSVAVRAGAEATCFMAIGIKDKNERGLTVVEESEQSEFADASVYEHL